MFSLCKNGHFNMCSLCKNGHYSLRNSPEERRSHDVSYFSTTDSVTLNWERLVVSNNVTPNLQTDQDFFLMLYILRATTLHIQNSTQTSCKIILFVDRCFVNTRQRLFDSRIYFIWRQTERYIFGHNNYQHENSIILYCNCILNITLILRIVTFHHRKNNFNLIWNF